MAHHQKINWPQLIAEGGWQQTTEPETYWPTYHRTRLATTQAVMHLATEPGWVLYSRGPNDDKAVAVAEGSLDFCLLQAEK